MFHFGFLLLFYTGIQLIYNAVLISGVEHSESGIHIHTATLLQILFPYKVLHSTE